MYMPRNMATGGLHAACTSPCTVGPAVNQQPRTPAPGPPHPPGSAGHRCAQTHHTAGTGRGAGQARSAQQASSSARQTRLTAQHRRTGAPLGAAPGACSKSKKWTGHAMLVIDSSSMRRAGGGMRCAQAGLPYQRTTAAGVYIATCHAQQHTLRAFDRQSLHVKSSPRLVARRRRRTLTTGD